MSTLYTTTPTPEALPQVDGLEPRRMTDKGDTMSPHPFHTWLDGQLKDRGETWADLSRSAGIGEAAFNRWKNGRVNPSIEMVRRIAEAWRTPILGLLVRAEILTAQEVRQQVVVADITQVTNDALAAEVLRRMDGRGHPDNVRPKNSPTPLFSVDS